MSLLRNDFPCIGGVSLLFDQPVSLLADMREAVTMLTSFTAERLQQDRLLTRTVTVWIETSYRHAEPPWQLDSRVVDLPVPVNDARLLAVFTSGAVDELYRPGSRYRAVGVYCEDLSLDESSVAGLLSASGQRTARPYGAMQRITNRYARRAVLHAGC